MVPPFADRTTADPLVDVPAPDTTLTAPPPDVAADESPALTYMSPPAPVLDDPTDTDTDPASPPVATPAAMMT